MPEHPGAAAHIAESTAPRPASHLCLLRSFRLSQDGVEIALARPAQRLLAFLALRRLPVSRDHAAETLWVRASQDHAAGSLRSALWKLRQPECELVRSNGGRIQVSPAVVVDVHQAATWARRQLESVSAGEEIDTSGLAYVGHVLPDWYDDWITLERERFIQLRARALELLCARLTAAGRFAEAIEAGLVAVENEPLRESAYRVLISVHLAEGNRAEAMRLYWSFRNRLRSDLGLEPSPRMLEALAHESGLGGRFAARPHGSIVGGSSPMGRV